MEKTLTKEEVQAQLEARSEAITRRFDAIEEEVTSTGENVKQALRHPLVMTGATVVLGVAVGLLFGGSRKNGRARKSDSPLDVLSDVVAEEAERAMQAGYEPQEALRHAIRNRGPFVINPAPEKKARGGFLMSTLSLIVRTVMGIVLRNGWEMLGEWLGCGGDEMEGEEV